MPILILIFLLLTMHTVVCAVTVCDIQIKKFNEIRYDVIDWRKIDKNSNSSVTSARFNARNKLTIVRSCAEYINIFRFSVPLAFIWKRSNISRNKNPMDNRAIKRVLVFIWKLNCANLLKSPFCMNTFCVHNGSLKEISRQ